MKNNNAIKLKNNIYLKVVKLQKSRQGHVIKQHITITFYHLTD